MRLSGRRPTASGGLVVEPRLESFAGARTHGGGETRGYRVVGPDGVAWSDADLDGVGVHVLRAVGASHRADELQGDGFAAGERVGLRVAARFAALVSGNVG